LKLTIITVCFNSAKTLADAIESVQSQNYGPLEHIIIDGGSTDGSVSLIEQLASRPDSKISRWLSEPDLGIYDAMNKGLSLASGDVIGFLNSDDMYSSPQALSELMGALQKNHVDCVFADLVYVDFLDTQKVLRYYNSGHFRPSRFRWGWMPAHPTFLAKRTLFDRAGIFSLDYKIAADYELLLRMLWVERASYVYLPKPLVRMRVGGVSTSGMAHSLLLNREIVTACRDNGIYTNLAMVLTKVPLKFLELVRGRLSSKVR
jgi:glycosyltransferase involved in cell wall biosynthesis